MSAFKQFLASDVIITPFEVNKLITCYGDNFGPSVYDAAYYESDVYEDQGTGGFCNIDRFLAKNITSTSSVDYPGLQYDTLVFVTGSSTGTSGFDSYPLNPGKLLVEYSQSAEYPTSLYSWPIRIKIHDLDLNSVNISPSASSFTNLEYQVGQSPTGAQLRDNVYIASYSSVTSGSLFTVTSSISASNPYSLFNKSVVSTPQFSTTTNISYSIFNPNTDPTTGNYGDEYQRLVYQSLKQLYYSNYTSQSSGNSVLTASLIPGNDEAGNRYVGSTDSTGRYENYLQSLIIDTNLRVFPTQSNAEMGVLSIPKSLYGDYIQPGSFKYEVKKFIFTDDSEGNLLYNNQHVGDIIYSHGIVTFYSGSKFISPDDVAGYGVIRYGEEFALYGPPVDLNDILFSTNVTCSFSSSLLIYETQYKATIRENEFNFSLNPSLISGSTDGTVYDFVTGSYFDPYVTTVGLYDEQQNLLAVGKLAQPLPTSRTTDTNIFINIDR